MTSSLLVAMCVLAACTMAHAMTFAPCNAIEALRGSSLPMDRSLLHIPLNVSYMNAATLGPMARPSLECAVEAWKSLEANPHNNYPWEVESSSLDEVRRHAASMLHCDMDELALTPSTTVSLNLIGEGLFATGHLSPTDRILTTDQEHAGGVAVWNHWVQRKKLGGVDRVALPVGKDLTPDTILNAFRKQIQEAQHSYRIICVSHVLTTTGARLPLQELAKLAHGMGALLIVDGAQGPGNINVNLEETGADAYTVSAHKWLLAPTGSGLLYVRKGAAQEAIQPAQLAGGFMAYSHNAGTVPLQTIAGLGYALDLLEAFGGIEAAEAYGLQMAHKTREAVLQLDGVSILSPSPGSGAETSILTITLPWHASHDEVANRLKTEFGVIVKTLSNHEGGTPLVVNCIRLSLHVYTTEADVEKFVNGLATVLQECVENESNTS